MEHFLERCTGANLPTPHRRDVIGFVIRLVAAVPCSPRLLAGPATHWALFVGQWGPLPFVVINFFWAKRHKAYWDDIRAREKARRAEKRATKASRLAAQTENKQL